MDIPVTLICWAGIASVPLLLTQNDLYKIIFPADLYDITPRDSWNSKQWPSPLGLSLGIFSVIIGQIVVLLYFWAHSSGLLGKVTSIQRGGAPAYDFAKELIAHLSQPEGFVMLGTYLIGTWMFGLMPASYYSFSGGINWVHVVLQLLLQDGIQYAMHMVEHKLDARLYKASHKPHHRFTNPKMFDAFNGSPADTLLMILVPLIITARIVPANVWSYMAFGSLYANWLTLIHSEHSHPWDRTFRMFGLGTAGDHHVHHKLFVYNYGHLFMYWDKMLKTYKDPSTVSLFNDGI